MKTHLKMVKAIALGTALSLLLIGCSSQTSSDAPMANVTRHQRVALPCPDFPEASYRQLLTFSYDGSSHSLIALLKLGKGRLSLSGLTPMQVKLFDASFDGRKLEVRTQVPAASLPPAEQVVMDIMLAYGRGDGFKDSLKGFSFEGTKDALLIRDKSGKAVYGIDYSGGLPVRIKNHEFGYSISIRYIGQAK